MVLPFIKPEELATTFPKVCAASSLLLQTHSVQGVEIKEVPSGKGYLRFTPQPNL
jgi:hypothetical protein